MPVHFHGHNDFGLATASAVAAVRAGATWVHGTINGMGERAGNANLGEVALTLRALYGVESNLRLDRIREVSARVRELSGVRARAVEAASPARRSTAARAARSRRSSTIRRRSSRTRRSSSATERSIVLGKKSGLDSIRIKAEELGLDVPEERRAEVLAAVKSVGAEKRGLVTDDEFRAIVWRARRCRSRQRRQRARVRRAARAGRLGRARARAQRLVRRRIRTAEITEPGFKHDVFSAWHPLWVGGAGACAARRRRSRRTGSST